MRQRWVWAAVVVFCATFSSLLWARQGTVVTKDNNTFDGDVTEDQGKGTVTIVMHGVPVNVKKANVQFVIYVDQVDTDVRQKLAVMGAKDVKGRLTLAQFAADHHALMAARDILVDAQRIDPTNADVRDALERVKTQLRGPSTRPAVAASTTQPVAPTVPSAPVTSATPPSQRGLVTREVTPEEISFIKVSELRPDDTVRVKLEGDVRRRFADYTNMPFADFDRLSAMQQAFMILDKGKADMKAQVKLLSDPTAIVSFRKNVQRPLMAGCATSKCHGGSEPAAFRLYPQDNDTASYTNFLVLSQYSARVSGRDVPFLNRQSPDQSMLLGFALPPGISDMPHPDAKGYHGMVRTRNDPRYQSLLAWIRDDLKPVAPDYSGVNLSAPPATQPSVPGSVSH
jgi:hypothetical protein